MNNLIKNMAIWLVIALVLMTVFNQFSVRQTTQAPMEYSQFINELKQAFDVAFIGHIDEINDDDAAGPAQA